MTIIKDRSRLEDLLKETIICLCENSLNFESKFDIEASIRITLDDGDDVLDLCIHETVRNSKEWIRDRNLNMEKSVCKQVESTNAVCSETTSITTIKSGIFYEFPLYCRCL